MYARSTTVRGDPSAVDEGIAYCRDTVWPTVQGMSGCVGMSMLVERDTGRCIVTAAWATEEAMRASAESVRDVRSRAAEKLRAESVDVNEWEIAALHRVHAAGDGACARVVWAEVDPDRMESMIDAFKMSLVPRMEGSDGFCSVSLMVDRDTGRCTWAVSFESRETMAATAEQATASREEFGSATGTRYLEIAEMEIAIAHLRVPEMA